MRRLFCIWLGCLLLECFALFIDAWGAAQSKSQAVTRTTEPVPFSGCKSDGQAGPVEAPNAVSIEVRLDAKTAKRLALYKAEVAPAVLGPRGWFCLGLYGSGGAGVFVTPMQLDPSDIFSGKWQGVSSFGIEASVTDGDTSGRFDVARIVARVFPTQRSFVQTAIDLAAPASDFPVGPFPGDRLTYRSERVVEYETKPHSQGLGTYFRLLPDGNSIHGVAILPPDFNLQHLAVRLPKNMNDLSPIIIRQFETKN
jgi:hypothetical protein